ncbi:hypothetical protein ACTFIY_004537 [Dictyostelium cf. discoideum]
MSLVLPIPADSNNLTLIIDNESLKSALDVGGELSLSYGLISGKAMGNYIDTNTLSNERITFLYTRRIIDKIVELDYQAKPSDDISKVTIYGLFYISKIEYGAILDLKITLESSNIDLMNKIKGELSGGISIGALSRSIQAHIDKEEGKSPSSEIKVTSSVLQNQYSKFDHTMGVINSFEVDPNRLVPVRMEISPIPSRATPLLTLDSITLSHYKNKVSSIGSLYWEFQQMITQLGAYSQLILPLLGDEDLSIYVQSLYSKVAQQVASLKKTQESLIKFIQNLMKSILDSEIPYTEATFSEIKLNVHQLIEIDENEQEDSSRSLSGIDNTEELQKKMEAKALVVQSFFLNTIKSKTSFKPEGMKILNDLKDEILEKLKYLSITVNDLSTITRFLSDLTEKNIESLINQSKSISLEEWLKDRGFAYINGIPKSKIIWPGNVYSTVCYAPECLQEVCHQGCRINFSSIKGDNNFKNCRAFDGDSLNGFMFDNTKCQVCPSHCSYQQHIHVKYQLEWIQNDKVLEIYSSIRNGMLDAKKKTEEYDNQAKQLKKTYSEQLSEFSKLKTKFKDLSVLGDMRIILHSTRDTYKQYMEIAQQANDTERAANFKKIFDELESFIKALGTTEHDESKFEEQFDQVKNRSKEKSSILNKLFD